MSPDLDTQPDARLVAHLVETTGLTETEVARIVEDVLAFHDESLESFVRRRHAELRLTGLRNPEVFDTVATELAGRVVAAPRLSSRQLRRIVHG
ncbi:hypothetical protein [Nocardioides sp.]|uniref:hypothetical protein n=1 Tax=Nocardioides sp. TaxID=35761 RepID=UPI002B2649E5|nr:hypothetical protein [Nocardioides sp.]